MINQIFLIFLTIGIFEFLNYYRLINILKSSLIIYKKLFKTLNLKQVSDFRKEKIILHYSKQLFIFSIKIFFILTCIIIIILVIIFISKSFAYLITSPLGLIEIAVIFYIYNKLRKTTHG